MTRTMFNLMFAAALLIGGSAAFVRGDETAAPALPQPLPQFAVFSSFGCSRSFHMDSSHVGLAAAIRKAQELRADKQQAWVVTGKPGTDPQTWADFRLLPGRRQDLKFEACSVYTRQCRGGWRMTTSDPSAEKAEAMVEEARKEGSAAEVVYLLASN